MPKNRFKYITWWILLFPLLFIPIGFIFGLENLSILLPFAFLGCAVFIGLYLIALYFREKKYTYWNKNVFYILPLSPARVLSYELKTIIKRLDFIVLLLYLLIWIVIIAILNNFTFWNITVFLFFSMLQILLLVVFSLLIKYYFSHKKNNDAQVILFFCFLIHLELGTSFGFNSSNSAIFLNPLATSFVLYGFSDSSTMLVILNYVILAILIFFMLFVYKTKLKYWKH